MIRHRDRVASPPAPPSAGAPVGWSRAWSIAAFLALLSGVLEVAVVMGAVLTGLQVRLSAHYMWMIPASTLVLFLAAASALKMASLARPVLASRAVLGGVLVGLAALCLLLLVERIHDLAMVLLAAGLGVQAGRLVESRFARLVRRWAAAATLVLAGTTTFLAGSMVRTLARADARALAALPRPQGSSANVLLLILDTVRQTSTSLHADSFDTPELEALSRNGVVFSRAIAPAPWTLPSHGSMFTGRAAHELSAGWTRPLDRAHPTLAEALGKHGYESVGFVGNTLFASRATGLGRGFTLYDDYPLSIGQALVSTAWGRALAGWPTLWRLVGHHDVLNRRSADAVTDSFVDWLDQRSRDRPFFAFMNFFDAHEPHFPPGRAGSVLSPGPRWTRFAHTAGLFAGSNAWYEAKWELTPEERSVYASGYAGAVRRADAGLGRVMRALRDRELLDNTVIIVAGDHGEQLGEHGLYQHNNSLYLPALRVPLLVVAPGVQGPRAVDRVVSLRDIPATVMQLIGAADSPFRGVSLLRDVDPLGGDEVPAHSFLEQEWVEREDYPVARGRAMHALTTERWHFIRNGDGSVELYDWAADPGETRNLAGSSADSAAARLGETLDGLIRPR